MSIAIAVKHMIEAGLSADAVAAAVAEMEAALKPARSKGAIRQARYRQRQQASRNVTSDANDAQNVTGDVTPLSPSPLSSPHTPQHTPHPHTPEIIHSARVKADPFPKPD